MDSVDVSAGADTTGAPADQPGETWEAAPTSPGQEHKLPKWPFVLAGLLLLLGGAVAAVWPVNVPYYALSPGPVNDTSDYVSVADPAEENGELFFLTVSLREINALEYLGALFDGEVDLRPRENIRPAGVSQEQLRLQNLDLMEGSKNDATFVALTRLGYDVTYEGTGAVVAAFVEDSPAEDILELRDLIVAVDGQSVAFSRDAAELVGDHAPGDVIELTVERAHDEEEVETFAAQIELVPFRFVDDDGNVDEDPERGMVGLILEDGPADITFPIDVEIDAQNIGGPSAGLMFTLEIMNQLTDGELTKGHRIAGTGTINAEGRVGPIGGVRQKVFAAREVGADYVLVPEGNYEDALTASGDEIEVVSIGTIDDALAFFDSLQANP